MNSVPPMPRRRRPWVGQSPWRRGPDGVGVTGRMGAELAGTTAPGGGGLSRAAGGLVGRLAAAGLLGGRAARGRGAVGGLCGANDRCDGRGVHAVSLGDRDVSQSGGLKSLRELIAGQRPGDATGVRLHVGAGGVVHVVVGHDVRDREPAAGLEHPGGFAQDPGLVGREVDDAVGDDDVDAVARQRDVLDVAAQPLHVGHTSLGLIATRQVEHLIGHVQPIGQPREADAPGGEQHVDPAARAEVKHGLALVQLGDRDRVAAAQRGQHGRFRQRVARVGLIQGGPEVVALLLGDDRTLGAATGRRRDVLASGHDGGRGVLLTDDVAQLCLVGRDAHLACSLAG